MPEISVIMPIFNSEKYVQESIESVLNQTFQDFELICVNHSSTDSSLKIINDIAKRDSRIRVFTIENKDHICYGDAENYGIKQAKGKFLCFIDSDDLYEKDFLEKMYNKIISEDLNVVLCKARYYINKTKEKPIKYRKISSNNIINVSTIKKKKQLKNSYFPQWLKIIKKSFYDEHNITFPTLSIKSYDVVMHYLIIYCTDKIGVIDNCIYLYRLHENQMSKDISIFAANDFILVYDFLIDWAKRNKEINFTEFKSWIRYLLIIAYRNITDKKTEKDIEQHIIDNYSFVESVKTISIMKIKKFIKKELKIIRKLLIVFFFIISFLLWISFPLLMNYFNSYYD